MSEAQRGRPIPESVREKISEALRGQGKSDETRVKMSKSTAGKDNPNWKGGDYTWEWYGPGWAVIRERVQERDEVCRYCGEDGSVTRLEVHHITPLRFYGESEMHTLADGNVESNLILLCRRCHGRAEHGSIEVDSLLADTAGNGSSGVSEE